MTEVTVRRAVPDDAGALAAVYRNAYRENRELGFPASAENATAPTVREWIREQRVLVAVAAGDVVGGVRLGVTGPERVKLSRLGVHDRRQGEGVGSRLLAVAEDAVRDWGYAVVWLTTPGEHPSLPDFYRARGYEPAGPYPLASRDYDEVVMEKRID